MSATAASTPLSKASGDHGCEYMTGSRVVVISPTRSKFRRRHERQIAYVHDDDGSFPKLCNTEMNGL